MRNTSPPDTRQGRAGNRHKLRNGSGTSKRDGRMRFAREPAAGRLRWQKRMRRLPRFK